MDLAATLNVTSSQKWRCTAGN